MIDYQLVNEISSQEFQRLVRYYDSLDIGRNPDKFMVPLEETICTIFKLCLQRFTVNTDSIPIGEYPKAFSLKYGIPGHIKKDHTKYTCRTSVGTTGYFVFYREFSKCRILSSTKGIRFDDIPFMKTIAPEVFAEFLYNFENIRQAIVQGPSYQYYLDYLCHRKAKFAMASKIRETTNRYKLAKFDENQ